jgi:hypothetical protein
MKLYQHYKGGLYIVTEQYAVNTNAEHYFDIDGNMRVPPPGNHFVHYYDNKKGGQGFVRPFKEFHEDVEYQGKVGPRFRAITDAADIMPEGGHP